EGLAVLEAADGAEAVQIGLQQRPGLALLDVQMPRLGGIEAAITLRELRPELRIALSSAQPAAHRRQALELQLPLFDKLEIERSMRWLAVQARQLRETPRPGTFSLRCAGCGYGVARPTPPERCPMCQAENTWLRTAERRLGRAPA
ncbi:MAG TPA: response regulator, partial [Gaiellaceae bacterium]|nr:response regulator [Gaiellaceae bacterium]